MLQTFDLAGSRKKVVPLRHGQPSSKQRSDLEKNKQKWNKFIYGGTSKI